MILPELAEKIVSEVKKLIDENIIFVDTDGTIIASTDISRVGNYHQGAHIAAERKEKIIITEEDQQKLIGVKAGINLPVFFRKDVIGVIGITGNPEKVSPFGEIIRKMIELLISENYFSNQLEIQSRSLETLVFEWIQNREWDSDFLNRARLLNVNLDKKRQAVMIELQEYEHLTHRDLYSFFSKWDTSAKNDIMVTWGNQKILLLRETTDNENREQIKNGIDRFQSLLKKQWQVPLSIGVGQKVSPIDLNISFKQAERALKATNHMEETVFDEDLTIEIILDEVKSDTKKAFIDRTIIPMIEDKELLFTLQKWFEFDLSYKKTAQALHIHINTLHYRLKKIQELTNLNPNIIRDRITLYFGILILGENTKKKL